MQPPVQVQCGCFDPVDGNLPECLPTPQMTKMLQKGPSEAEVYLLDPHFLREVAEHRYLMPMVPEISSANQNTVSCEGPPLPPTALHLCPVQVPPASRGAPKAVPAYSGEVLGFFHSWVPLGSAACEAILAGTMGGCRWACQGEQLPVGGAQKVLPSRGPH